MRDQIGPGSTALTRTCRRVLLGQRLGDVEQPRLAGAVIHEAGLGLLGEVGAGVDDRAPTLDAAIRGSSARQVRTDPIRLTSKDRPALVGDVLERGGVADAKVVDRRCRGRRRTSTGRVGGQGDAIGGGQVGGDGAAPLVRLPAQRLAILVADHHHRPFLGEQIGNRLADAVRTGADECQLAPQLIVQRRVLVGGQRVTRRVPIGARIVTFDI